MNKAQLIDAVAAEAGMTKADAKKAIEAFVKTTTEALKQGDRLLLSDLDLSQFLIALHVQGVTLKLEQPLKSLERKSLNSKPAMN